MNGAGSNNKIRPNSDEAFCTPELHNNKCICVRMIHSGEGGCNYKKIRNYANYHRCRITVVLMSKGIYNMRCDRRQPF